jgi:uncharacterized protein (TIGR02679 family)
VNDDAVVAYLRQPGMARLTERMICRIERAGGVVRGRVSLDEISEEEISCIAGLLGGRWRQPLPNRDASVSLQAVDDALRASRFGSSLPKALALAAGRPLRDRPGELAAERRAREEGWQRAFSGLACGRHPELGDWLARVRGTGQVTRMANRTGREPFALLGDALTVLAVLPLDEPRGLPRVSAELFAGNTKTLGLGTPVGRLVCAALAFLEGSVPGSLSTERRRDLLDSAGAICDALSSSALCAGLRPAGTGWAVGRLRDAADAGMPCALTLHEIADLESLQVPCLVHSTENPEVISAALERFGVDCPALVCTQGWPSTACVRLLRALASGGAEIRHHGDFDWAGLRIAARLREACGAQLWRMTARDYLDAPPGEPLDDRVPRGLPDDLAGIAEALTARGVSVMEEMLLDVLLEDLSPA